MLEIEQIKNLGRADEVVILLDRLEQWYLGCTMSFNEIKTVRNTIDHSSIDVTDYMPLILNGKMYDAFIQLEKDVGRYNYIKQILECR